MSLTDTNDPGVIAEPAQSPRRPAAVATWVWALVATGLLATSATVRGVQDRKHQSEHAYKETCPIPLDKMPHRFAEWLAVEGGEKKLDALTMRITGGTDHSIMTYVNELTGVNVTVLLLFGPAEPVIPHTPQVCYPASGYSEGESPSLQMVPYRLPAGESRSEEARAEFLSASYYKAAGRQTIRQAVYHSFRLDGIWSPFLGNGRKFPRRNPGVFKLQIIRQAAEGEAIGAGDPIEQFLSLYLTELEAEIRAADHPSKAAEPAS